MFSRTKFFGASLAAGILVIAGVTGLAQQPQNPEPGQSTGVDKPQRPFGHREGRGGRKHGRGGLFGPRIMQELNLSDDQKQQVRTIIQESFESTKAQRDELRQLGDKRRQGTLTVDDQARAKTLHEQIRASMKDTREKTALVLTAEQKAKAEELMKQRKANHERFGRRRGAFPRNQANPPTREPASPPSTP